MSSYEQVLSSLRERWEHVMVPDLTRITTLLDLLGDPQRSAPAVHLTGTNGKTSTARMIDALLRAHDIRAGRITSPHLSDVRERICIEGAPVSEEVFVQGSEDIAALIGLVDERVGRVTYFEVLTALAFAIFADTPVDAMVVEVGLGGTWDATNVLQAGVTVVTPVSLDHTELLGETLEKIATEKAGIIHSGSLAVLAQQSPEVMEVLLARCDEVGATPLIEGTDFGIVTRNPGLGGQALTLQGLGQVTYVDLALPLFGVHQAHNAALALAAAGAFLGADSGRPLDDDAVLQGFALADSPGRLEIVRREPTVLLDGAHNPGGVRALVAALNDEFAFERLTVVLSVLGDKDVSGMVTDLVDGLGTVLGTIVCTSNDSPRALPTGELADIVREAGAPVEIQPHLPDALAHGFELVRRDGGGLLVTGSLVTVGQARTMLVTSAQ